MLPVPEYLRNIWATVPEGNIIKSKNIKFPSSLPSPISPQVDLKQTSSSIVSSPSQSPRRRGKRGGRNYVKNNLSFYHGYCKDWNIIGRYGFIDGIICESQDIVNAEFIKVGQLVLYQLEQFPNNTIKCVNVFVVN